MPFGIAAGPGTFQALMTRVLENLKEAIVYLRDILIFTKDRVEHIRALEKVLRKIKEAGLWINLEKCHLIKTEVKYLGHIIDKNGVKTDPSKIKLVKSFYRPKCVKNLSSFFYGFSKLEALCGSGNSKLAWTE